MDINYKIIKIHDGLVDVDFGDGRVQTLAGCPLDYPESLNQYLYDYGVAYAAGLAQTQALDVPQEVQDLVGQSLVTSKTEDAVETSVLKKGVSLQSPLDLREVS